MGQVLSLSGSNTIVNTTRLCVHSPHGEGGQMQVGGLHLHLCVTVCTVQMQKGSVHMMPPPHDQQHQESSPADHRKGVYAQALPAHFHIVQMTWQS